MTREGVARFKITAVILSDSPRSGPGWNEAMHRLSEAGVHVVDPGQGVGLDAVKELVRDADVLIVGGTYSVPGELIRAAFRLRLISRQGSGVDNIDVSAASELGVAVCNTAGSNADAVADHTFAMILALERRLIPLDSQTKAGHGWDVGWPPSLRQITGQTIGVIGTGKVGSEVVRRASVGFGMQVLGYDIASTQELVHRYGLKYVTLDELLAASSIVTIHVPLTPGTRGMIGRRELELMPRDSILINTARGGIVDETALLAALESGHLAGAGLDVFEREPSTDGPLLASPKIVLSPHAAGQSPEASRNNRMWSVENILAFLQGRPINPVNANELRAARHAGR